MDRKVLQSSEDCDLAFGLNRMSLKLLGIWPDENDKVDHCFKGFRTTFILLWMIIAVFLPQMYALVKVYPDLLLVIDNVLGSSSAAIGIAKLLIMWHNRKAFETPIHWMRADWTREKDAWERDLMLKQARRGRLFTVTGLTLMVSTTSCFLFSSIIGLDARIVNNITDLHERRYFPMQSFYPYNFTKQPNFELTYASQGIGICFAALSYSVADGFFAALGLHVAGQCEILSVKLTRLFDSVSHDDDRPDKLISFKANLCRTVQKHIYLIRFVSTIENSFNVLVLVLIIGQSITMCCLGFSIANTFESKNSEASITQQLIILLAAFLDIMLHLLLYCLPAEILTSSSEQLLQASFNSNWYLFPAKYSRDVIPLMIRSQYPFQLTVGKFYFLSLNFYTKILKTIVSIISMLLAVKS